MIHTLVGRPTATHTYFVLLGQVGECAKKVPDYWVGTAVQKYYFVSPKSKTVLLDVLVLKTAVKLGGRSTNGILSLALF